MSSRCALFTPLYIRHPACAPCVSLAFPRRKRKCFSSFLFLLIRRLVCLLSVSLLFPSISPRYFFHLVSRLPRRYSFCASAHICTRTLMCIPSRTRLLITIVISAYGTDASSAQPRGGEIFGRGDASTMPPVIFGGLAWARSLRFLYERRLCRTFSATITTCTEDE